MDYAKSRMETLMGFAKDLKEIIEAGMLTYDCTIMTAKCIILQAEEIIRTAEEERLKQAFKELCEKKEPF